MYLASALFSGVLISIMVVFNGKLSDGCGLYSSTVIIYLVSVAFSGFLLLLGRLPVLPKKKLPLWMYSAGLISVFSTVFTNFAFGKISVVSITALGLLAQTASSFAVDAFGLFGAEKRRISRASLLCLGVSLAGCAVMLAGAGGLQFLAMLLAFASGVTLVVSRMINADLAKSTGSISGAFINHAVGLPAAVVVMLILGGGELGLLAGFGTLPWWTYLGGVLGIAIVALTNWFVPKISALNGSLLLFIGQLASSALIDAVCGFRSSPQLLLGGALITAGVAASIALDRKRILTMQGKAEHQPGDLRGHGYGSKRRASTTPPRTAEHPLP